MKTRFISIICVLLFVFLSFSVGCGGGSNNTSKVLVTFTYNDGSTVEVAVKKGEKLTSADLPKVEESTTKFDYDWYINLSKPIDENMTVRTLKYTRGVQIKKNGSNASIGGIVLQEGQSQPTSLILPTYYKGAVVTLIDHQAFESSQAGSPAEKITSVILPEYLTTISGEAFEFCRKLEAPEFPETLTFIGSNAFNACSFDTLELPSGLTNLAERAFGGGNNTFTIVKVPNKVTVMESYALTSKKLRTMIIPVSVVKIEDGGIWPTATYKKDPYGEYIMENGLFVLDENDPFRIFYEGNAFDWEDFYVNISDVDVANISDSAYDKAIPLHSSRDLVDAAIIYLYSEDEPTFDSAHPDKKYWKYDQNGEIFVWDDPAL